MKKIFIALLSVCSLHLVSAQQGLKAVEGKEGIWLFYSNEILGAKNSKGIVSATISRADAGGNWKEIGTAQANLDISDMKKKYGSAFPSVTAAYLNLKDENGLIDFMRQHPSLDDYGFLVFDLHFMQSAGAAFLDANKPATGSKVKYRVQLKTNKGSQIAMSEESEVTIGAPLLFNPVTFASKSESDSTVSVTWRAKNNQSEPFYFGNIYRLTGDKGTYAFAGKVLANTENDTVKFNFSENVLPGGLYKYYLRPTNLTGLEGKSSDTVSVIAADFNKVEKLENFTATDTTGGVYFSWTPLKTNTLYSGIAVQRKPMTDDNFISLDTISSSASFYLDSRIIPNIVYQYQFRLVNLRWKPLPPSATVTAVHRTKGKNQHIPFAINAEPVQEGIRVSWNRINHYDLNGYYVYRSVNGDEYKLQSALLKDTVFTDTAATNGRTLYNYKISALNFSDAESDKSNSVQAKPLNKITPIAPKGIFAYHEAAKSNIQWNNTKSDDALIVGYFVYRKDGAQEFNKFYSPADLKSAGFIKLNEKPLDNPMFSDTKVLADKEYTYAVTSIDVNAAESDAEQFVQTTAASVHISAPSFFGLTKTATGVQLSWDAELNKSVSDYAIYRRARNETALQLIGSVKASELSYTDKTTTTGTFYFYAIKAKTPTGAASDYSLEKGIAK